MAAHRGSTPGPEQRTAFASDVARYLGDKGSLGARLRLWTAHRNFRVVACYRYTQRAERLFARSRVRGLVPKLVSTLWRRRVLARHHALIDKRAQIGPGLLIMHDHGLIVGPVTIGANCTLHQNVTIGMRAASGDQSLPTIGDNVWIGPGAVIAGDVTIGDGVTIAAGTVLTRSVPSGCLVAGNPGRVIQQGYDNSAMLGVRALERKGRAEP